MDPCIDLQYSESVSLLLGFFTRPNVLVIVIDDGYVFDGIIFLSTFCTSIISATFGIMKVLKYGPCQLLLGDGILGGFCQLGNILVMFSILFCLLGKGFLFSIGHIYFFENNREMVVNWSVGMKMIPWPHVHLSPNWVIWGKGTLNSFLKKFLQRFWK